MNTPFTSSIKALLPRKGSFAANVLTLMGGGILASLIILAASPILTRLFTPKDFGVLALFISITTIIGGIASWRYEMAIMLPREDQTAANILGLCLVIITGMSGLCLLLVIFFNQTIARLLQSPELSPWLWLAPLSIFLTGSFNAFHFWCTRQKKFQMIAVSKVGRSIGIAGAQLGSGLVYLASAAGLIAGQIFGQGVGTGMLVKQIWRADGRLIWSSLSASSFRAQASRHKKFPLLTSWGFLANSLSYQIPVWFIASGFGTHNAGFFSVANNAIALSINLITLSISKVFYQRATELKNLTGSSYSLTKKTTLALTLIAAPPFITIMIWGPEIFSLVFGEKWVAAGRLAAILTPLFWSNFVLGPLTMINAVHEAQEIGLLWQLGQCSLTLSIFYLAAKFQLSIDTSILYYSISTLIWNLINIAILVRISQGRSLFYQRR